MPESPGKYRTFSSYLKERFGAPVRKVSVNAGFTCPNRDGNISRAGCSFCDPATFAPQARREVMPLIQQFREGIAAGRRRGAHKFLAYFQPYTNTYAPVQHLKDAYDSIRAFPEIVALAIGTRPDCVNKEILRLIHSYTKEYEVWMEYGLQSISDKTLRRINRGHDSRAFLDAVALTRTFPGIKICVHVILGLPGEDADMERATAETCAQLRVEGIKLHPLHVIKGTPLEKEYRMGAFQPLALHEYTERAALFLEQLWPETVVQRLTADVLGDKLAAPDWLREKNAVLDGIRDYKAAADTWQGKRYQAEIQSVHR